MATTYKTDDLVVSLIGCSGDLAEAKPMRYTCFIVFGVCLSIVIANTLGLIFFQSSTDKISATVPFQSAVVIMADGITAVILFIQCYQFRQLKILILSSAYLFCSMIALAQLLTFPDTFPSNVAIPHVSPWLWTIWHFSFPVFILAYLVSISFVPDASVDNIFRSIVLVIFAVFSAVLVLSFLLIVFRDSLPAFYLASDRDMTTQSWRYWLFSCNIVLVALACVPLVLSRRRLTMINLCLVLSLVTLACEVLCVMFIESRYTLPWYFARLDGVVSSGAVLVLLIIDNARLYRDLADINRILNNRVVERTAQMSAALLERERALERQAVTEDSLRESEERFRAAQEASLDGFIIYRPIYDEGGKVDDLRVVYANPVAARYFQGDPEAMAGRSIGDIISGARNPGGLIERYALSLMNGKPAEYVHDHHVNGHFLSMIVPFDRYLAVTFRDISDQIRQRDELNGARVAAEAANAAKTRFLASVSHDLRQPIMAQRLLLYTATQHAETPQQSHLLTQIGEALDSTGRASFFL